MNILIAGGSGFLGQALTQTLVRQHHHVTILTRDPSKVAQHAQVQAKRLTDLAVHDQYDVVINLTGAGIADARWSDARKAELLDSRLQTTQALVRWMHQVEQRPQVLLSGSAIGWYGAQGDLILTEHSQPHDEFVHQLCAAWEKAALEVQTLGIRTVLLRTGVVLHPSGGMLKRVLLPFKLGLGGRLGDGQQWMSWVSRQDWIAAVLFLMQQASLQGAFNLTAPAPETNQSFTSLFATALGRPAFFPAPAWVLKLLLGEMSGLLLDSQRIEPMRLQQAEFQFSHPELASYLSSILK
jgi:hypothetical protein